MKGIVTPGQYLDTADSSFRLWLINGFPGADKGIEEIVTLFNDIDGLVTTDCCTGHPGKQPSNFYVNCIVNLQGAQALFDIFERLNDIAGERGRKRPFTIRIRRRGLPHCLQYNQGFVTTSVLTVGATVKDKEGITLVREIFLEALKSYLKEMVHVK